MVKKSAVPDAWDDDWETAADKMTSEKQSNPQPEAPPPPQSKAQRLAQHAETNRKLWESADTPKETFHFLEANNTVPLTSQPFKPQVKVLSRKPVIAKRDPTTGMSQMSLGDDDDTPQKTEAQPTPEEIRAKQRRDREEKQRRYDEARAKIFGESAPSSGASSPSGTTTPPRSDGQSTPRGRGRGGRGGAGGQRNGNDGRRQNKNPPAQSNQQLYDPNYAPKPDSSSERGIEGGERPARMSTPKVEPAIRAPRGPDGSGRGGFGFARRGAKDSGA